MTSGTSNWDKTTRAGLNGTLAWIFKLREEIEDMTARTCQHYHQRGEHKNWEKSAEQNSRYRAVGQKAGTGHSEKAVGIIQPGRDG